MTYPEMTTPDELAPAPTPDPGAPSPAAAALADDELWGSASPTPTSPDGPRPSHARRWLLAVGGAAAIAAASVVGAHVASSGTKNLATAGQGVNGGRGGFGAGGFGGFGGPGGRGDAGAIASISGSTIKLTTQDGTAVNVVTSGATTVSASAAGSVGDIKVGDNVRVVGTTSGTTVAADQVTDSGTTALADLPGGPGGRGGFGPGGQGGAPGTAANGTGTAPTGSAAPPVGATGNAGNAGATGNRRGFGGAPTTGVVKTVSGGTFTLTTDEGSTLTVTTSSSTAVSLVKPSTLAALKVGDEIQVNGTTASDGTITATNIRSGAVVPARPAAA